MANFIFAVSNGLLVILTFQMNLNIVKGHLRYKTRTSQNVPSEAQIKNFFIS